jgi:hypothetical protein
MNHLHGASRGLVEPATIRAQTLHALELEVAPWIVRIRDACSICIAMLVPDRGRPETTMIGCESPIL